MTRFEQWCFVLLFVTLSRYPSSGTGFCSRSDSGVLTAFLSRGSWPSRTTPGSRSISTTTAIPWFSTSHLPFWVQNLRLEGVTVPYQNTKDVRHFDTPAEFVKSQGVDVTNYNPGTNTLTLEVDKGSAEGLAKDLAAKGYKVSIDGVPYNY